MKNLLLLFITFNLVISCNSQTNNTNIESKKSIAEAISIIPNATIKETIAYYHKLKKEQSDVYNFDDENELNTLGYQYINNGKTKDAIEIFKLLVSEFPNSSNAFDSLGEAYETDGNNELAIINFKKALVLDPTNPNSERGLFRVNYKTRERPKFDQVFTRKQYLEDIDELAQRITKTHTNPFEFIKQDAFNKLVATQKSKINEGMTYGEFIWLTSPIIASVGCQHTRFGAFNQEDEMLPVTLRFPLEADLQNSELLVTNAHINNKKVPIGSSIKTINGKTIDQITLDIFKHIPSDGNSNGLKRRVFSAYLTSIIPYYFGFPEFYEITLAKSDQKIMLSKLETFKYTIKNRETTFNIIKEKNYAKLRIPFFSAYGGKKLRDYQKFIDTTFKNIKSSGVKNLIIDLRGNGGGCSCGAIYLLQYIAQKPFTYYHKDSNLPGDPTEGDEKSPMENRFIGNTYILMDGFSASATGHLLSVVKDQKTATLIGEESGASYYSNSDMRFYLATHTALKYSISTDYCFTTANYLPRNKGVLPDHYVYKTRNDIRNKKDAQIEYVLKLIKK